MVAVAVYLIIWAILSLILYSMSKNEFVFFIAFLWPMLTLLAIIFGSIILYDVIKHYF